MTTLTSYGRRLVGWTCILPPLAVDAVIAAACWLVLVVQAAMDKNFAWWLVVLATANALPLLWRRRYPFAVTAVVGASTVWLVLAGGLHNSLPAAQLVATYTFASLSPPGKRLVAAVCTAFGVMVSILAPAENPLHLGPVAITFAVAYALGTGARARRDRIAMLEERAWRLTEEQAAAATRERERIAREMHDILAHSMSLVVVQAEAGPVAVRSDPDKAEEVFDTISATAREALAQLRRALGVLRADAGGEADRAPQPGLAALPSLVDSIRRAGLPTTLEEHGQARPLPADLAVTAYRLVQESLTNTVRHAGASRAWVRLEWRDGALRLEVRDDGRGPNGERTPGGLGLVGMRERVAAAGGELSYGPGPAGVGFQVAATLPVQ